MRCCKKTYDCISIEIVIRLMKHYDDYPPDSRRSKLLRGVAISTLLRRISGISVQSMARRTAKAANIVFM